MGDEATATLGPRWLTITLSGLVGGGLAAAALATPGLPLGEAVAFAAVAAAGFFAGRGAQAPVTSGVLVGLLAGELAYLLVGGPAFAVRAAESFWEAAAARPTGAAADALVASAVARIVLAAWAGAGMLVATFGGAGATGGLVARALRSADAPPADPQRLFALGASASVGTVATALAAVPCIALLGPLSRGALANLADHPDQALAAVSLGLLPAAAYAVAQAGLVFVGGVAANQGARFRDAPEGLGQARFLAYMGVGSPLAVLAVSLLVAPGGAWSAAGALAAVTAIGTYLYALRDARGLPLPGKPALETPAESVAGGLSDAAALWNPFVAGVLHTALSVVFLVLPWSQALSVHRPPPATEHAVATYGRVSLGALGLAFFGVAALGAVSRVLSAAIARRRANG